MKALTIGSRPDCDLVLTAPAVAAVHLRAQMDAQGYLWLEEQDPSAPVHLRRNGAWLRVRRATLCTGDRVRLGDFEVDVTQLTAPFGNDARLRSAGMSVPKSAAPGNEAADVVRLKRNPVTGKIEESP